MIIDQLFESPDRTPSFDRGDPVIITGDVRFRGKTGDVREIGQDGAFVVVNLYNYGSYSFHTSDVSLNDYAVSDDEAEYQSGVAEHQAAMESDLSADDAMAEIFRIRTRPGLTNYDQFTPADVKRVRQLSKITGLSDEVNQSGKYYESVRDFIKRMTNALKPEPAASTAPGIKSPADGKEYPPGEVERVLKRLQKIGGFKRLHPDPDDQMLLASYVADQMRRGSTFDRAVQMGTMEYKRKEQGVSEGDVDRTSTGLIHRARDKYGAGAEQRAPQDPGKYSRDIEHLSKGSTSNLEKSMGIEWPDSRLIAKDLDETDSEKIGGRYDPEEFDQMMMRLKALAGSGTMKTVWDPERRVYRNVPDDSKSDVTEQAGTCPTCGGPAFTDLVLAEKQDACYHKVKSRYKVWPSAYASGALVQCRKKGAANWGTGGKKE